MMVPNFNQYAAEGNAFLKGYAWEINLEGETKKAGRILTAILHALRDVITVQESIHLLAQLPIFLKAVYVNGWSTRKKRVQVKTMEDFIDLVREYDKARVETDFEFDDDLAEYYITNTFTYLKKYISQGEMENIRDILPKELKGLINSW